MLLALKSQHEWCRVPYSWNSLFDQEKVKLVGNFLVSISALELFDIISLVTEVHLTTIYCFSYSQRFSFVGANLTWSNFQIEVLWTKTDCVYVSSEQME